MTDNEIIKAIAETLAGNCGNCAKCDAFHKDINGIDACYYKYAEMVYSKIIPCKVGDYVWAVRRYNNGKKVAVRGKVSEMYYIDEAMKLCIVVKGICRGEWGKVVFPSCEAAKEFLKEDA